MFHKHKWVEESRHFTAPLQLESVSRVSTEAMERFMWGLTVVVLRCDSCGLLQSVEIKGHAMPVVKPTKLYGA